MPRFPGKGYAALLEDTAEKAKEWAEKEGEKALVMEGTPGSKGLHGHAKAMRSG